MLKVLAILIEVFGFGLKILDAYTAQDTARLVFMIVAAVVTLLVTVFLVEWLSNLLTPRSDRGVLLHYGEKLKSIRGFPCIVKGKKERLVGLIENGGVFRLRSLVKFQYQGKWVESRVHELRVPTAHPTTIRRIKVKTRDGVHWLEPDNLELLSTDDNVRITKTKGVIA